MSQNEINKFSSGAASSGSLPMYDIIPFTFLERTAERFTLGAKKYGKFNYRKGLYDKDFILDRLNHAFVHLKLAIDRIQDNVLVEDDDLGAVAVNIAMAMEYQEANLLYEPFGAGSNQAKETRTIKGSDSNCPLYEEFNQSCPFCSTDKLTKDKLREHLRAMHSIGKLAHKTCRSCLHDIEQHCNGAAFDGHCRDVAPDGSKCGCEGFKPGDSK